MNIEDKGRWKGWEYESANGLHMVMTKSHFFMDGDAALCGVTIPQNVGVGAMDGECGRCRKSLDRMERLAYDLASINRNGPAIVEQLKRQST